MKLKQIMLDHGSGGLASQELIEKLFLRYLDHPLLADMEDSAVFSVPGRRLAMSTDSYVVDPLFFPGGDIGQLAVHGTINDLAMRGARPLYLSLAFILEEGLSYGELEKIIRSIAQASKDAAVPIITGDTKVVERGKADKIFINSTGLGVVAPDCQISLTRARPGDKIIISGPMGDHGLTIMSQRSGLSLSGDLASDTMPLHGLVGQLLDEFGPAIHTLHDPTRGGVATGLNEIASHSKVALEIMEAALPIRPQVAAGCEILGLDPLYLANEGKVLIFVAADKAQGLLNLAHSRPEGREAAIIGQVQEGPAGRVSLITAIGGSRLLTPLQGQPLPRIC